MPRQFEKPDVAGGPFRLGEWLVEPSLNRLSKGDTTIQLELKVMDVLVCLAERAGEVVPRQEIVDRVWATEFISDNTLTHAVTELRQALGDDARNPDFIETIHRRGYRLIAPVEPVEPATGTVHPFPTRTSQPGDERSPYPGLAAFTEDDAEFFFGREAEVSRLWRKITTRRLLAVIGPSGVGKSSLLRAGLIPAAPEGWGTLICQPGEAPFAALAGALAPEFRNEPESSAKFAGIGNPDTAFGLLTRWRERHAHGLLIVDQFEELFTLNPTDVQDRFSALLRMLVDQADVYLLLSLRDDFLYRCQSLDPLHPVLDGLVALQQPNSDSLKRALVEPARRFDFDFEDDRLASEMIAEVEGERGALPLLAFAVGRLWDKRDRENKALTRQAYGDIGGVGGALARHAESTMQSIGNARRPIVREIFRNLVTSQGTRAARSVDSLMSVFSASDRDEARDVLRRLIDARLLTSFEEEEAEGDGRHQVEIVHESLLASWPRLAGWQTQDADAARIRDELRQAARTWNDHDRTNDMLWTGATYREFASWRERYPGGLTNLEEAFAGAMTSFAKRRKRRRRIAKTAVVVLALLLAAVFGSLWRRSVHETLRAEASKLVTLGELEMEDYPTAALAWATASLELADTVEARILVTRAVGDSPPVTVLLATETAEGLWRIAFSESGEWFGGRGPTQADLWHESGRSPFLLNAPLTQGDYFELAFAEDNILLTADSGTFRWWSVHDVDQPIRVEETSEWLAAVRGSGFFSYSASQGKEQIQWWPLVGGASRHIGSMEAWNWDGDDIDATGSWLAYPQSDSIYLRSLVDWDQPPRVIGNLKSGPGSFSRLAFHPDGEQVAAVDRTAEIHIWSTDQDSTEPARILNVGGTAKDAKFDANGKWLGVQGAKEDGSQPVWLFDLEAPQGVQPIELKRTEIGWGNPDQLAVHPNGDWFVASTLYSAGFWPTHRQYPWIFDHGGGVFDVMFTPDGRWLLSCIEESQIRAWPLAGQNEGRYRMLFKQPGVSFYWAKLALHPSEKHVAVGSFGAHIVYLIPLDGGPVREFPYPDVESSGYRNLRIAFSPDGRLMAVVPTYGNEGDLGVQLWDLETGEDRMIGSVKGETASIRFVDQRRILWTGQNARWEGGGEYLFDLDTDSVEILSEGGLVWTQALAEDGSTVVEIEMEGEISSPKASLVWRDFETGEKRTIASLGKVPWSVALDPTDQWAVTGGMKDGVVRVGRVSGEEPHMLYGHEGWVYAVAVSPDGRWIASGGDDGTLRIWPMPDLSKPPLHSLPHDELIAKLKTLTNIRVVRDEESSTGWRVEVGPFPGWAEVPEW